VFFGGSYHITSKKEPADRDGRLRRTECERLIGFQNKIDKIDCLEIQNTTKYKY